MMMAWSGCWRKASAVAAASWSAPAQAAVKRGQQRQVLHPMACSTRGGRRS